MGHGSCMAHGLCIHRQELSRGDSICMPHIVDAVLNSIYCTLLYTSLL